jgi:hypothetical protein
VKRNYHLGQKLFATRSSNLLIFLQANRLESFVKRIVEAKTFEALAA